MDFTVSEIKCQPLSIKLIISMLLLPTGGQGVTCLLELKFIGTQKKFHFFIPIGERLDIIDYTFFFLIITTHIETRYFKSIESAIQVLLTDTWLLRGFPYRKKRR